MRVNLKATEKQISYAKDIAECLGLELPKENSKLAYRDFIDQHLDEYKYKIEIEGFDFDSHADNFGDRI